MFDIQVNSQDFKNWPVVLKLLKDSFAYMDDRIDPRSSLYSFDLERLRNKAAEENFILAFDNDELIGCTFFKPFRNTMYIGKVAVLSRFRQQGLARGMFDKIEKLAIEQQIEFLELETRVELIENHKTFRSMGFIKVAEKAHKGYSKPTSITMRKTIHI